MSKSESIAPMVRAMIVSPEQLDGRQRDYPHTFVMPGSAERTVYVELLEDQRRMRKKRLDLTTLTEALRGFENLEGITLTYAEANYFLTISSHGAYVRS